MRVSVMVVLAVLFSAGLASAVTVDLTDGRFVQGDIVKQDAKSLEINVDGVHMTYYADEIKDIDGQPFAPQQAPAAAQQPPPAAVPAAQPEAAKPEASQPAPPESAAPAPATGTIDPDKKALILKFIDVFGTRQALTNNFDLMVAQIEKEKPDEAKKIRDRVKVDEIIERLMPIYDHNFSSEDLKSFIAFYSSWEGQKLISTIPVLMKESVQESVKYMEEKFPEVKQ
jgi:hypothetical protein